MPERKTGAEEIRFQLPPLWSERRCPEQTKIAAKVMMDIHCNEQMWVVSRWVESVLVSQLCKCDQEIGLGHSCCSDR